jgi:hypothetical protein
MAMDYETRRPVIRMQRLETLLMISSGLGWEVVIDPQQRSKPRTYRFSPASGSRRASI